MGHISTVPPRSRRASQPHKDLGAAVHLARQERGLTQEELGLRTGLHPTYISGIEAGGRNPTWLVLKKLSRGLDMTTSELVQRVEELTSS